MKEHVKTFAIGIYRFVAMVCILPIWPIMAMGSDDGGIKFACWVMRIPYEE